MTTNNSLNLPLSGSTGTGNFVGATSPTLITPNLGTPSAGILTSCSGLTPVFRARCTTAQTFTTIAYTKVQCNTEDIDSEGWYDNVTNYRYTPLRAGRYLFTGICAVVTIADTKQIGTVFYKNGTAYQFNGVYNGATGGLQVFGAVIMDMNGSTDYVELFVYNGDASSRTNETVSVEFESMFSGAYLL